MIDLPFVAQERPGDCGPACVCAVLRHLNVPYNLDAIRVQLGTTDLHGTFPERIAALFRWHGLKCVAGSMELPDLEHHAWRCRPVICLVDGHYVVSRGLVVNNPDYLAYMDPLVGDAVLERERFRKWWRDRDGNTEYVQHGVAAWR